MNNALKLIQLDKSLIKPYNKYFLIILIIPVFSIYTFKDFATGMSFFMVMASMTSSYTFSVAEKNDLNRLYGLLPVTKGDIVLARYLFTGILGLIAAVISIIMNIIVLSIAGVSYTNIELMYGIGAGLIVYFLFTSVQLPGYFKFGTIKGRVFVFVPLIGIFLLGWISRWLSSLTGINDYSIALLQSPTGMLICSILLCVVMYGISLGITNKIYGSMEL